MVAISAIVLSGCITTNQQGGTLIGAATGGLLGSQIGSGTGRLVATGLGVLAGAMAGQAVGQHMDKPPTVIYQNMNRPPVVDCQSGVASGPCSNITNSGVRSSCERGHADRRREVQRAAERRAYQCSRYGKCW